MLELCEIGKLKLLSEKASKYMNYGEHDYKELCKTNIFKKAKNLLLDFWKHDCASMCCNKDLIQFIVENKGIYWCEECGQIHSINFMTVHHEEYDWEYIFNPYKITPMCISCHIKHHKKISNQLLNPYT